MILREFNRLRLTTLPDASSQQLKALHYHYALRATSMPRMMTPWRCLRHNARLPKLQH